MELLREKLEGKGADIGGKKKKKMSSAGVLVQGGKSRKAAAKSNPWIQYVKAYSEEKGISYKEALSKAGPSYRKMSGTTSKKVAKRKASGASKKKVVGKKKAGIAIGGLSKARLIQLLNTLQ